VINSGTLSLRVGKWVSVTTAWRILRFRIEERPPAWKVAANIFNKQSRMPKRGGPTAWVLSEELTTPHLKNVCCYGMFI
jgi:hypothetical protein